MGQLIAEGVGEGGVPLVHQVDRRRNHERGDTSIRDGLNPKKRLAAPGREHDAASSVMGSPRIERRLLVLAWIDLERRIESKFGVRLSRVLDRNSGRLDGLLVGWLLCSGAGVLIIPCVGPFEQGTVRIGGRAVLLNSVVPLRVRNVLTGLSSKSVPPSNSTRICGSPQFPANMTTPRKCPH